MTSTRPPILASTIHVATIGTVRQVLGRHATSGEWVILATLDTNSDARVMLADMRALSRALKFNLVEDRPPPRATTWIDDLRAMFK